MDGGQLHLGAACFEYDELTPKVSINTYLGAWKHWTAKLTSFFSNQMWVGGLYRKLTPYRRQEMDERRKELGMGPCSIHEDGKVTGTPYLKSAQTLDRFELFYGEDGSLNLDDTWDDAACCH
ncbi:unnamed protein product [Symbiodinium sp. CCMP2592]|nr:unnamed protein product [Symbiodinium sp. CCMP2592]